MNLIIRRSEARPPAIFVRCSECHSFVARYALSEYYHHGKGVDSWLHAYGAKAAESGRHLLQDFTSVKEEAVAEYEQVMAELERLGKDL
jgi:hypothetical protein